MAKAFPRSRRRGQDDQIEAGISRDDQNRCGQCYVYTPPPRIVCSICYKSLCGAPCQAAHYEEAHQEIYIMPGDDESQWMTASSERLFYERGGRAAQRRLQYERGVSASERHDGPEEEKVEGGEPEEEKATAEQQEQHEQVDSNYCRQREATDEVDDPLADGQAGASESESLSRDYESGIVQNEVSRVESAMELQEPEAGDVSENVSAGESSEDEELIRDESSERSMTGLGGVYRGAIIATVIATRVEGAEAFEMKMEMESLETIMLAVMIVIITLVMTCYRKRDVKVSHKANDNPKGKGKGKGVSKGKGKGGRCDSGKGEQLTRAEVMSSELGNEQEEDDEEQEPRESQLFDMNFRRRNRLFEFRNEGRQDSGSTTSEEAEWTEWHDSAEFKAWSEKPGTQWNKDSWQESNEFKAWNEKFEAEISKRRKLLERRAAREQEQHQCCTRCEQGKGEGKGKMKSEERGTEMRTVSVQSDYKYSYWRKTPRFEKMSDMTTNSPEFGVVEEERIASRVPTQGATQRTVATQSQTTRLEGSRFEPLTEKRHGAWELTC